MFKSMNRHMLLFPFTKYLGVDWLNHMVDTCLISYQAPFQSGCTIFHSRHQCIGVPVALNVVVDSVLNLRYYCRSVVLSPWDFDLHSSNDNDEEHLFRYL